MLTLMSEAIPAFLAPVGASERRIGRLVLFVVLAIVLALGANLAVLLAVSAVASALSGQPMTEMLGGLASGGPADRSLISYGYEFAVAGLSLYTTAVIWVGLAARFNKRPMRSFITAAPRFRWRMVGLGFLVAAPLVALALLAEMAMTGTPFDPPVLKAASLGEAVGYAAIAAVCLFLAALAEEMIFRGWLLQQTAAFTRSIAVLVIVNGAIFSLAHFDPDPGAFAVRAAMGAGWAWIALRLGGLEFAAGAHLANNLAISLLAQPLTLAPPSGEAADPGSVLLQLGVVAATVAAVEIGINLNKRGRIAAPR